MPTFLVARALYRDGLSMMLTRPPSSFALRTARRGQPTPGHPEYTFLGFSILKSCVLWPGGGLGILGGGQTPWRGPRRCILGTSYKVRKLAKWVILPACKKWGKAVMSPLAYRMEMALPLARASSPVRYQLAGKEASSSGKTVGLRWGDCCPSIGG